MRQTGQRWLHVLGLVFAASAITLASAATSLSSGFPDARAAFQLAASSRSGRHTPDPGEVEASLVDAARRKPLDFEAQRNLGEFYIQGNRLPQGIAYLEMALQLNPADYNAGYDLSLAYLESSETQKASAQLKAMIARKETSELDELLAEAEEKLGDYKQAALAYHRAAEIDPGEDPIFNLASFLLQHPHYEGFLDQALVFFRYGAQKYPQSAKLAVGLGVTLYAEGKYDDAVRALCAAVDLNPSDPKPYQFLGKLTRVSPPLLPEIRNRLAGFVRLYPDNGPAAYYYAMSLWQQAESESTPNLAQIETLLKKAAAAEPSSYEAHFQLGVLYQDQQKYSEAISELDQTLALRPDFNRAHYRLMQLYNRTHRKDLADQQLAILKQIKKQDADAEELEDNPENLQTKATAQQPN
jgi:tetratricopeptide (TPR) repeat protein